MIFAGFILAMASLLAWQKEHRESIRAENLAALKAFDTEANWLFEESLTVNNAADYTAYLAKARWLFRKAGEMDCEQHGTPSIRDPAASRSKGHQYSI
jgi:hypothetical protein